MPELYCTRLRSAMVVALILVRSSSVTGRGRRRAGGGGGPAAAPVQGAPDALDPVEASAVGACGCGNVGQRLSALVMTRRAWASRRAWPCRCDLWRARLPPRWQGASG